MKKVAKKKAAPKKATRRTVGEGKGGAGKTAPKKAAPDRAEAAAEVLEAVWLHENNFELESKIDPADVIEDEEGHVWVAVRLHVPALDIDMWLDGTHPDHPDNKDDDE